MYATKSDICLNPRPAGCLDFPRHAGGGVFENPPANSAPRHRSEKQKMRSKVKFRQKSLRNYFSQFFVKVNIDITKGHQSSNLAKNHFFRKCAIISETILGRREKEKAFDRSWAVLSLGCNQI